jgi:hypothetical protein
MQMNCSLIEMLINRQVEEFIAAHRHVTGAAESSG